MVVTFNERLTAQRSLKRFLRKLGIVDIKGKQILIMNGVSYDIYDGDFDYANETISITYGNGYND